MTRLIGGKQVLCTQTLSLIGHSDELDTIQIPVCGPHPTAKQEPDWLIVCRGRLEPRVIAGQHSLVDPRRQLSQSFQALSELSLRQSTEVLIAVHSFDLTSQVL